MEVIFWPAVRLMLRRPNEKKLPLMLAIFFLPLARQLEHPVDSEWKEF